MEIIATGKAAIQALVSKGCTKRTNDALERCGCRKITGNLKQNTRTCEKDAKGDDQGH